MSGWIKLHRSLKGHFLFDFNEPDKALAWIDLLLSASFEDGKIQIKGRVFDVKRGQFCVSQVTLQQRWGMSQNKVKRFLNLLKSEGMVDVLTNDATTIITICNYEDYQSDDREDERANERADERTTNEPRTTLKEGKEGKEEISSNEEIISAPKKKPPKAPKKPEQELDYSCWPSMPSEQVLNDWLAMRKNAKATTSQTVITTFGEELTNAVQAGYSVDQCLSECITRNWRGFKLNWLHNAGVNPYGASTNQQASTQPRDESNTQRGMRLAREAAERLANQAAGGY